MTSFPVKFLIAKGHDSNYLQRETTHDKGNNTDKTDTIAAILCPFCLISIYNISYDQTPKRFEIELGGLYIWFTKRRHAFGHN